MASPTNRTTLETYETHLDAYIAGTSHEVADSIKNWLDRSVLDLPLDANILEVGSGFGRDAGYLESLGYRVVRTDAAQSFVRHMTEQGHDARVLNVLTDDFGCDHNLIVADAVFLHLTPTELTGVLATAHAALAARGRLAFTLKKGAGEEWSTEKLGAPRYFRYWGEEEIVAELHAAGFILLDLSVHAGEGPTWLHVVAERVENS